VLAPLKSALLHLGSAWQRRHLLERVWLRLAQDVAVVFVEGEGLGDSDGEELVEGEGLGDSDVEELGDDGCGGLGLGDMYSPQGP